MTIVIPYFDPFWFITGWVFGFISVFVFASMVARNVNQSKKTQ